MVVGRLPARPLLDKDKLSTLLAPPTVPHTTPLQAPGVVLQGSKGAEPGHQLVSEVLTPADCWL